MTFNEVWRKSEFFHDGCWVHVRGLGSNPEGQTYQKPPTQTDGLTDCCPLLIIKSWIKFAFGWLTWTQIQSGKKIISKIYVKWHIIVLFYMWVTQNWVCSLINHINIIINQFLIYFRFFTLFLCGSPKNCPLVWQHF